MPMDDRATGAAAVASPRWMRMLLVVSLALNLLVAGALLGVALRGGPSPVAVRDLGFGPFAAALSPEDRAALRQAWMTRSGGSEGGRRAMRADMRALLDILRAEPFDAEALRAHLEKGAERTGRRLELGLSLIAERVTGLSPAERLAFADRLERELRRGPHRRDARRDGGDAP
ncbi:MAG: periplasmic heavy metal sensor [Gemmobacter sp.]